jgi:hypothetical protein
MMRMAVLGDSVAWGQGLLDGHKYANLLQARMGGPSEVELAMPAHSGATIGITFAGEQRSWNGEVPKDTPTVVTQLDLIPDPSTIDLVLVNGGINDVNVRRILDPLTRSSDLRSLTWQACHVDMKKLLGKAIGRFGKPTCRFIVTGYYPILSAESDPLLKGENELLDLFLGHHGLGFPIRLDKGPIVEHIIKLCITFWQESSRALSQAVADAAREFGFPSRMAFVPCPFTEQNALFAGTPMLFGFGPDGGPQDEVIGGRAGTCKIAYPDLLELPSFEMCRYASVGHPNPQGALAIADAVWARMNS